MNSPQSVDPTIIGIAQGLGRVEGKVDALREELKPLEDMVQSHEEDINLGKGALAALSVLWVMTVAAVGIVLGFFRR